MKKKLRAALNVKVDAEHHISNTELYSHLPKLSDKIRQRRLKLAGHCLRRKDELVSKLLLWTPSHGRRGRGRPAKTYIDVLKEDTGLEVEELGQAMLDKKYWAIMSRGTARTRLK